MNKKDEEVRPMDEGKWRKIDESKERQNKEKKENEKQRNNDKEGNKFTGWRINGKLKKKRKSLDEDKKVEKKEMNEK